ncbi:MAG: phosphonate ABC transporter, permease protein PhnE [Candidatus Cloacimonadales bacterium]|jgi:phosphonate transport system permease protein|nr:phosphonate ABC transporter, permease protein PhnE [Candidatus Cloacimonadota bacterium]MDY0381177.1 phosphonate ABC transporter, permease protein PhnE [Candidatus Cloacimonadaceae bacterium]HCM14957.1 phosphonate ABC transporter, permease protein PhnE [Candidatus Cloacimonas sp.]MCB5256279.1 phosphonate ABC transporter, permease protein PhnE [Candidatus Cloacimonadota bacterium]MCB5263900.1 phosphonate ABC transporter, permease protein PhnE [Candidatus Cloacimonadota bacterium]
MKHLKCALIEYGFWLYNLACLAWLMLRLGNLSLPLGLILAAPVLPAVILIPVKAALAQKIMGEPKVKRFWKYEAAFSIILSIVMAWVIVEIRPLDFLTKGANTSSILSGLFRPNTANLVPMLAALVETIYLALMATVLAIPFAFVLSFFAAKNLMYDSIPGRIAYIFIRTISTIFRSIEAIVWAIIFVVWVGIGPFAGMLALWIHSIAALIKLYSEQIENIDPGQVEAIKATGASTLQVWRYAVAPQILAPYLAFTIYRWDINVRMATIVGFVGGGGIGLALYQEQQMLSWRNVGLIMWLIALVVWIMDMFSGYIREKLVSN